MVMRVSLCHMKIDLANFHFACFQLIFCNDVLTYAMQRLNANACTPLVDQHTKLFSMQVSVQRPICQMWYVVHIQAGVLNCHQ